MGVIICVGNEMVLKVYIWWELGGVKLLYIFILESNVLFLFFFSLKVDGFMGLEYGFRF